MFIVQILQFIAGGSIVFASLPQIIKVIKHKKTRDFSLQKHFAVNIITSLYALYIFIFQQPAEYIRNIILQVFSIAILYLKVTHE